MGSVKFLSNECGTKIRQGQVISAVSDVVRELVDNAIDAGAKAIHVFLENFGTKKIEVRDSGRGISETDVPNIFKGGYTSKLKDEKHLSCGDFYGFRGEALASICGHSGVLLTTKTESERGARKYVISKNGNFSEPYIVPAGTGTSIVVENLFKDYPVRQKHATTGKTPANELKILEAYLKSLALANPGIHFMLYHNSQTIWTKPVTKNMEHALTAVLGVPIARSLSKPIVVDFSLPEENADPTKVGNLQVFLPKPPADMRAVGSTSNQNTFVLINRRRIFDTQFEQLVKRYVIASADQPTNAEQRKFPACLVSLTLPPSEVDFNRETNKAKVFLKQKDHILWILENTLKKFYNVDLSVIAVEDDDPFSMAQPMILTQNEEETSIFAEPTHAIHPPSYTHSVLHTNMSTPEKRQENIQTFLSGLARPKTLMSLDMNPVVDRGIPGVVFNSPDSSKSTFLTTSTRVRENTSEKTFSSRDSGCGTDTSPTTSVVPCSTSSLTNGLQNSNSLQQVELKAAAASIPRTHNVDFGGTSTDPLCNVIIHNDPWLHGRNSLQDTTTNILEPSTTKKRSFQPFSSSRVPHSTEFKRPKLFDNDGDRLIQTPKLQTSSSRQTTLQELPSWQSSFGSTSSGQRRNSAKQASLFESIDDMNRHQLVQKLPTITFDLPTSAKTATQPVVFHRREGGGLLTVSVKINLASAMQTPFKAVSSHSSGNYDASVICRLDTPDIFVVKIDGLVGAFHATRFLRFFPQLLDPEHFRFDSDEYVLKLVIEFTKCWESMSRDDAITIFHVLADTEDMDKKYAVFYPY